MIGSRRWSLLMCALATLATAAPAQDPSPDDALQARLQEGQTKLRRGNLSAATAAFEEVLDAVAEEGIAAGRQALADAAQTGLWTIGLRRGKYEEVRDGIAAAPPAMRDQRDVVFL